MRRTVELYRTLATRDPSVFHAKLATSLNNLGIALAGNAQCAKALEVTQEAVKLYRPYSAGSSPNSVATASSMASNGSARTTSVRAARRRVT